MLISRKFIIYGAVGTFVTVVKLSVLFLLRNMAGIDEFTAVTVSYVVAVVLHYFLNKHVTFMVRDRQVFNLMTLKYASTLVIAYLVYTGNIFLLNRIVGISFYPSVFLALGISYVVNYALYNKIVFVAPAAKVRSPSESG